jgi:hypothetical protein
VRRTLLFALLMPCMPAMGKAGNQVERYEPEGSRGPGGERKLENRQRVLISDLATGDVQRTYPGRRQKATTGAGVRSRTGRAEILESLRRYRPGALTRPRGRTER